MDKIKIMIVEDEVIIAKELQLIINDLGYDVCAIATTGEEAVQKAGEYLPDLILMDINLIGDMDGIEAAEKIQSEYNIPVIYVTALADSKVLTRAKVTEPYGYILKPYEERELYVCIEIALYKHQAEKERKELRRKVKILSGFLPICASCKKIRNDQGYWQQIESYIRNHSEAEFTHSLCVDCQNRLDPDFNKDTMD
jgi:two-component system, response regulator PdtaR